MHREREPAAVLCPQLRLIALGHPSRHIHNTPSCMLAVGCCWLVAGWLVSGWLAGWLVAGWLVMAGWLANLDEELHLPVPG